jgi:hypothetical protein
MTTATTATKTQAGRPVLDPISGKPCIDTKTGRPYVYDESGKPTVAPVVVPPDSERLTRLEDALGDLAHFVVEGQRYRLSHNTVASAWGERIVQFLDAIATERAALEKRGK